jgi:hypothetical protein
MASSVSRPSETISSPLRVEHKYQKQQPCPFAGLLLLLLGLNNCACLHTPHNYIPELGRLVCLLGAKLKVKIRRNCFPQTQIPCGKIEIFLMLNPMPAQLLRQTRTAPYSKKEITDVCQIHSQKKERMKDDPASFFFFFFFLQIPHGSQSLCHESQQRSSRRKKPKRKKKP